MRIKSFLTDWLDQFLMAFATLAMGYACNGCLKICRGQLQGQ